MENERTHEKDQPNGADSELEEERYTLTVDRKRLSSNRHVCVGTVVPTFSHTTDHGSFVRPIFRQEALQNNPFKNTHLLLSFITFEAIYSPVISLRFIQFVRNQIHQKCMPSAAKNNKYNVLF